MADLLAPLASLRTALMPDHQVLQYEVAAGEANFFPGALAIQFLTGAQVGKVGHADEDTAAAILAGVVFENDLGATDGIAAGALISIHRGIIVGPLNLKAGTAATEDIGRPMYLSTDDNTIADYGNVTAAKFKIFGGELRSHPSDPTNFNYLYIPGEIKPNSYGLQVVEGVSSLTGESQEVDKTVTGLEEIIRVTANVEEGVAVADAAHVTVKTHVTAGSIEFSVFKESAGALVASTVAKNIQWVAVGNVRPMLAI
jgi:hypothetical protein